MAKNNVRNIIIVIVAAAVMFGGILFYTEFLSCTRYNLQDYIYDVQFSGENGDGYVCIPIINYNAMDSLGFEKAYGLSDVMDTVNYTAEPCEGLSNGDEVTITAYYNENLARARRVKLTNLTWTVVVNGLEDNVSYNNSWNYYGNPEYLIGEVYTVQEVVKVRAYPDVNARQLKRSELSNNEYAQSADYPDALLQKGSQVVCQDVINNWIQIESGWICVNDGEEVLVR